jgi:hypothetical protein
VLIAGANCGRHSEGKGAEVLVLTTDQHSYCWMLVNNVIPTYAIAVAMAPFKKLVSGLQLLGGYPQKMLLLQGPFDGVVYGDGRMLPPSCGNRELFC